MSGNIFAVLLQYFLNSVANLIIIGIYYIDIRYFCKYWNKLCIVSAHRELSVIFVEDLPDYIFQMKNKIIYIIRFILLKASRFEKFKKSTDRDLHNWYWAIPENIHAHLWTTLDIL